MGGGVGREEMSTQACVITSCMVGRVMEQGDGQICFRESKDLFTHEWILFSSNGKIKYSQFVSLPRPLGSLQLSSFEVLKTLRETNIWDCRAVRKMFLPPHRVGEPRRWVCGSRSKGRDRVTCHTYREISNDGFRVICSKREGEQFQKKMTIITERNNFYSKGLNYFSFSPPSQKSYHVRLYLKYV